MPRLHIAQNDRADAVISGHSFGLLVGMLLEQQIAMEVAFSGPAKIYDRFGTLDPTKIAAIQLDRDGGVSGTSPTLGEGRRAARAQVRNHATRPAQPHAHRTLTNVPMMNRSVTADFSPLRSSG